MPCKHFTDSTTPCDTRCWQLWQLLYIGQVAEFHLYRSGPARCPIHQYFQLTFTGNDTDERGTTKRREECAAETSMYTVYRCIQHPYSCIHIQPNTSHLNISLQEMEDMAMEPGAVALSAMFPWTPWDMAVITLCEQQKRQLQPDEAMGPDIL